MTRGRLHNLCIIVLAIATSGCSLLTIEDVPSPFPENLPYGQILQEKNVWERAL